jgi:hypothetical protein
VASAINALKDWLAGPDGTKEVLPLVLQHSSRTIERVLTGDAGTCDMLLSILRRIDGGQWQKDDSRGNWNLPPPPPHPKLAEQVSSPKDSEAISGRDLGVERACARARARVRRHKKAERLRLCAQKQKASMSAATEPNTNSNVSPERLWRRMQSVDRLPASPPTSPPRLLDHARISRGQGLMLGKMIDPSFQPLDKRGGAKHGPGGQASNVGNSPAACSTSPKKKSSYVPRGNFVRLHTSILKWLRGLGVHVEKDMLCRPGVPAHVLPFMANGLLLSELAAALAYAHWGGRGCDRALVPGTSKRFVLQGCSVPPRTIAQARQNVEQALTVLRRLCAERAARGSHPEWNSGILHVNVDDVVSGDWRSIWGVLRDAYARWKPEVDSSVTNRPQGAQAPALSSPRQPLAPECKLSNQNGAATLDRAPLPVPPSQPSKSDGGGAVSSNPEAPLSIPRITHQQEITARRWLYELGIDSKGGIAPLGQRPCLKDPLRCGTMLCAVLSATDKDAFSASNFGSAVHWEPSNLNQALDNVSRGLWLLRSRRCPPLPLSLLCDPRAMLVGSYDHIWGLLWHMRSAYSQEQCYMTCLPSPSIRSLRQIGSCAKHERWRRERGVIAWMREIAGEGWLSSCLESSQDLFDLVSLFRDGSLLCAVVGQASGVPVKGWLKEPKTTNTRLSNIEKAVEHLRCWPPMPKEHLWPGIESALAHCDWHATLCLLEGVMDAPSRPTSPCRVTVPEPLWMDPLSPPKSIVAFPVNTFRKGKEVDIWWDDEQAEADCGERIFREAGRDESAIAVQQGTNGKVADISEGRTTAIFSESAGGPGSFETSTSPPLVSWSHRPPNLANADALASGPSPSPPPRAELSGELGQVLARKHDDAMGTEDGLWDSNFDLVVPEPWMGHSRVPASASLCEEDPLKPWLDVAAAEGFQPTPSDFLNDITLLPAQAERPGSPHIWKEALIDPSVSGAGKKAANPTMLSPSSPKHNLASNGLIGAHGERVSSEFESPTPQMVTTVIRWLKSRGITLENPRELLIGPASAFQDGILLSRICASLSATKTPPPGLELRPRTRYVGLHRP